MVRVEDFAKAGLKGAELAYYNDIPDAEKPAYLEIRAFVKNHENRLILAATWNKRGDRASHDKAFRAAVSIANREKTGEAAGKYREHTLRSEAREERRGEQSSRNGPGALDVPAKPTLRADKNKGKKATKPPEEQGKAQESEAVEGRQAEEIVLPFSFYTRKPSETEKAEVNFLLQKRSGGNWRFVTCLYDRTSRAHNFFFDTVVSLYILFDENEVATKRIVVKSFECYEEHRGLRDLNIVCIHRMLELSRARPFVTHYHGALYDRLRPAFPPQPGAMNIPTVGYRSYSHYCPHGNLADLLGSYALNDELDFTEYGMDRYIPETFIWIVLESLAEALYQLNYGLHYVPNMADIPVYGWTPLQHRDIKPGNIFLDTPSAPYDSYPHPQLGDLDTAQTREEIVLPFGTAGYEAPENHNDHWKRFWNHETHDGKPTEKSDIFAVGMVIWDMMHAEHDNATRAKWREGTLLRPEDLCAMDDWALREGGPVRTSMYSEDLCELMRACLRVDPELRPSVAELRRDVDRLFSQQELDLEMRFGRFTGEDIERRLQVVYPKDEFPIGKRLVKKRRREVDDDPLEEGGRERYSAAKTTPLRPPQPPPPPPVAAFKMKKAGRHRWDTGIVKP